MGARQHPEPMTVEEFYRIPDDGLRHELVAGCDVSEPLPGFGHGSLVIRIGALLEAHVRSRSLGTVVAGDAGFVLSRSPDTVRGPDVAFVSRGREGGRDRRRAFEGPPDMAVEILSPSDRSRDARAKAAEYLAAGTRIVWVVDPEVETVTVHRPRSGPLTLAGEDILDAGDVIPGLRIPVGEIFER